MVQNKRSDEVPAEQAPGDGPLTQLVDQRVRTLPDDRDTDEESAGPAEVQKPVPKEYATGTAEHDDDAEA